MYICVEFNFKCIYNIRELFLPVFTIAPRSKFYGMCIILYIYILHLYTCTVHNLSCIFILKRAYKAFMCTLRYKATCFFFIPLTLNTIFYIYAPDSLLFI